MTDGRTRVGTFAAAWSHRRWRWLISGFAVSMVGDFLYSVALVVFLMDRTGSASWVSAAVIGRLLPYALLSAPAGVLADRIDRRRLMIALDLMRAVLLAVMAALAWAGGPALVAVLLAVGSSVLSTAYRPAAVAATPKLMGEDDLAAANAAESVIAQAAWFVGPALGTWLVTVSDPGTAFVVNAATFVASAVMVARIGDVGGGHPSAEAADAGEDATGRVWVGLAGGVDALRQDPGLAALVAFVSALLFTFGMEQVLHVLVAVQQLGLNAEWVGVMGAAIGAGGLMVAPFTPRLGRSSAIGWLLVLSGFAAGTPMIVLALSNSKTTVLLVLAVEGAAVIVNEVLLITVLQRACPSGLLARVFGLQESASSVTQLLGAAIAPVMVAAAGLGAALWIGGAVSALASVLLAPVLLGLTRRLESDRLDLAPRVEMLRGLALFGAASDVALERMARAARVVAVPSGSTVIDQGDPPESVFVITGGEMVVEHRRELPGAMDTEIREVNRMQEGDWFGEIGLLHDVPRTATVRALSRCELLAIPGDVFLDSLGGPDLMPDPVRRIVNVRLARTATGEDVNDEPVR